MQQDSEVDQLIASIIAKLNADKAVLARSVEFGWLTWRRDSKGMIQVKIQPEL